MGVKLGEDKRTIEEIGYGCWLTSLVVLGANISQSFIINRGLIVRGRLYYWIREDYGIVYLVGVNGAEGWASIYKLSTVRMWTKEKEKVCCGIMLEQLWEGPSKTGTSIHKSSCFFPQELVRAVSLGRSGAKLRRWQESTETAKYPRKVRWKSRSLEADRVERLLSERTLSRCGERTERDW